MLTTEDQCEDYFKKSTSRDLSGRLCVALPFRDLFFRAVDDHASPNHNLGDSRSIALKRFYNLERWLAKYSVLYVAYRKFISTYLTLCHMVPGPEAGNISFLTMNCGRPTEICQKYESSSTLPQPLHPVVIWTMFCAPVLNWKFICETFHFAADCTNTFWRQIFIKIYR